MIYFNELDELYRHMQDEITYLSDIAQPLTHSFRHQLVVGRLVYFTRKLCTAMEVRGFPASYSPSYYEYNEHQQVVLAEDDIRIVVTVTRYSMYSGILNTDSTKVLFDYLETTLPLYRQMVADIRRRRAIYNYCGRCHYADNRVQHCGMGNLLDAECRHYTAKEVIG